MRTATLNADDVRSAGRFDSEFYLEEGHLAFSIVSGGAWPTTTVAAEFGSENAWFPNRFARVYADCAEYGKPILVPYDLFRYQPESVDFLSRSQVRGYNRLEVKRGWLMLTCSGRNLGPVTMIDRYTEQFVLSHDMIRLAVGPSPELFYLVAFLRTWIGQALLRRDRNGSVIDHLNPEHLTALRYPKVGAALTERVASAFQDAFEKREAARLALEKVQEEFHVRIGFPEANIRTVPKGGQRRYAVTSKALTDRLDAEFHAPAYKEYRKRLASVAEGRCLGDVADVHKPQGRYRTIYVDDRQHGVPNLSGRQMALYWPIGLKFMSPSVFDDVADYRVREDMILLTADGRAEEKLADTVLVRGDRDGWTASGHIHRILPREGNSAGLVYLACACFPVQAQLKALATGSVVDALSAPDVASVTIPWLTDPAVKGLADKAVKAWDKFAAANLAEESAILALETELCSALPK